MRHHDQQLHKRNLVALEFVSSEQTYLEGLDVVVKIFCLRLKVMVELGRPLLTLDEIQSAFLNVEEIRDMSRLILEDMKKLQQNGLDALAEGIGPLFLEFLPYFKMYTLFVNHYHTSSMTLREYRKSNKNLEAFMCLQERCEGTDVSSLLITPVQRIPRYLLLLDSLIKEFDPMHHALPALKHALDELKSVASNVNESCYSSEARSRVLEIQRQFFNDKVQLVHRHR